MQLCFYISLITPGCENLLFLLLPIFFGIHGDIITYYRNHILLWKVVRYEILICTQCKCQALHNARKITFFSSVMRLKQQGFFFSFFVIRLFATVLWFKKKQSIQITCIFIYINQHTNQWGFLMLVSEIKIKKKFHLFIFFCFPSVFLGDGVAFLWGCFFFLWLAIALSRWYL